MSRRAPKSKGARTVTAKVIRALADDLGQYITWLGKLADSYVDPHTTDLEHAAAEVDFALDELAKFTRHPVWPRAHAARVKLIRAGGSGRGPVQGSMKLGPASCIIIVCCTRRGAEEDIRRETHRDPRDRRIRFVTDVDDIHHIYGLDRNTPWMWLCSPERDTGRIRAELRARFEAEVRSLPALVSMLDWTVSYRGAQ